MKKIIKKIFIISLFCFLLSNNLVYARTQLPPTLEVPIEGVKLTPIETKEGQTTTIPWIGQYLLGVYGYLLGFIAILAGTMLVLAGVKRVKSAGNQNEVTESNAIVWAAISGLVIGLLGIMGFNLVNPETTGVKDIEIYVPEPRIPYAPDPSECEWTLGKSCPAEKKEYKNICKGSGFGDSYTCCCDDTADADKRNDLKSEGIKIHCSAAGFESLNGSECACRPGQTNCTSLVGMQPSTIKEIKRMNDILKKECGENLTITGGTEKGHASGMSGHGGGWKFDAEESSCMDKYIFNNCKEDDEPRKGKYPGRRFWCDGSEYVYENEGKSKGSHWDVTPKK